jgi:kinesin family protein 1
MGGDLTPSQTEEMFDHGNPWAGLESTATTNSISTPLPELELTPARELDTAVEQRHLTNQLRSLAQEVKRVRAQAAKDRALSGQVLDPANWTAKEWRLVHRSVERWRRLREFKLAEQVLTGAVQMREANIIA